LAALGVLLAACGALGGCAVAVIGGAVAAGGVVSSDRRTPQTQWDDQLIELRAGSRVSDALGDKGHVSITSFYGKALLTGEVPTEEDRQRAQTAVASVPVVVGVVNELAVMPDATFGQSSNDTLITSKVKAGLLNASGVPGNSIKVVTARGTVYLMGRLTQREIEQATNIASTTGGVQRVVRVFDVLKEDDETPIPMGASAAPVAPAAPAAPAAPLAPGTPEADAANGVVVQPVTQTTFVEPPPPPEPIQVQSLPPVK